MLDIKLVADLHVHTIASGHAYSTVAEVIEAASQRGLEALALTDHGPSMPGGPYRYYFGNLFVIPEREKNVEILKGVEANIIGRDGTLDLRCAAMLDIVWQDSTAACQPDLNGGFIECSKNYVDGMCLVILIFHW